jgi:hypothetical protein
MQNAVIQKSFMDVTVFKNEIEIQKWIKISKGREEWGLINRISLKELLRLA